MTILYKMNNMGLISWWEIEPVSGNPALSQFTDDAIDSIDPNNIQVTQPHAAIGYNTWWGSDHTKRTRDTDNTQFTPRSDKPTMSVQEQVEAQINEMIARKGYSRELPDSPPDLPMLAQTWKDFLVKANSGVSGVSHWSDFYYQPKLDGIRCIGTPLTLYSRRNTPFTAVPHIEMAMNLLISHPKFGEIKLDGELYIPGADLQTIQGTVSRKSYDPMLYREVHYYVFDAVVKGVPFYDRLGLLNDLEAVIQELWDELEPDPSCKFHKTAKCPIRFVPTEYMNLATHDSHMLTFLHDKNNEFRSQGYEGVILRQPTAVYQPDYRTFDLIKYKDFADAEFMILDVLEAKNDMGVFLCSTLNGATFKCTPSWTTDRKKQILKYKDNYIGRRLTVKYERLSKDGIPLKPIGVTIRD